MYTPSSVKWMLYCLPVLFVTVSLQFFPPFPIYPRLCTNWKHMRLRYEIHLIRWKNMFVSPDANTDAVPPLASNSLQCHSSRECYYPLTCVNPTIGRQRQIKYEIWQILIRFECFITYDRSEMSRGGIVKQQAILLYHFWQRGPHFHQIDATRMFNPIIIASKWFELVLELSC